MISVLSNIQDDICNYADAISGITGTDVEIIDESLMRIAGTGNTGTCLMRTWQKWLHLSSCFTGTRNGTHQKSRRTSSVSAL
jgi:hypothetical protein